MAKKSRKKRNANQMTIDAMTIWNIQKPRYNGFSCGYGVHGKRGYDRNAMKRQSVYDM